MKFFYGVCGYGMGHAGRALALIERFQSLGHETTIFTFADALHLLRTVGYEAHDIEGLSFSERRGGGVSATRTAHNFVRYMLRRSASLDLIRERARAERPDLMITDFEPLTALAAASLELPCVSIDNQHRFCLPLGNSFPLRLRAYGRAAGEFVRQWIRKPQLCVVSVFHECPQAREFVRVNAMVRDGITRLEPTTGEHVLIYGRGEMGRKLARAARQVDAPFRAYGFNGVAADNVEFKSVSGDEFVRDLASCRAVVCAAGQQLISEARYFGKRLLVVPMPKQHEQEINARYAAREGIGNWCKLQQISSQQIAECLEGPCPAAHRENGVDQILELLEIENG